MPSKSKIIVYRKTAVSENYIGWMSESNVTLLLSDNEK